MSGPVSLLDTARYPLVLASGVPNVMHAATTLQRELAKLGQSLVRGGLPMRTPDVNDTPGTLIETCLDAELQRIRTPELGIAAFTLDRLGYDEDYIHDTEEEDGDGLDDDAVVIAAYHTAYGVISFSGLRAVLDAFEGPAGIGHPLAPPIPLGLALHVACEHVLGAALRVCGPVGAMDLKTFDGTFDVGEEYHSIRDDLARERLRERDRVKGKLRNQLPEAEITAECKKISDAEVDAYALDSEMLTLKRMYEHYGITQLPPNENVTLSDMRRILTHAVKCGLPQRLARTVRQWVKDLQLMQQEAQAVHARLRALEDSGNILGRLNYGFRPPTLILDVRGPGERPGSDFIGSLYERVNERGEADYQNPDPEVPIAAALLTRDNAADILSAFTALGNLERRAGAFFRRLSSWGEAELAQREAAAAA